ncbi:hypothetical protein GJ700_02725 [Duganella sp. FT92W]|uniref:Uncharacterized protein n=1 Tax=Pseudoduganella rivuli TaxID=2666085 RepID=A0A7X2IIF4_9BURK|nr:hypothetical protein [Pseudoduganella rivuli]MRV70632.1 hypothetical protein [Pseudoduganella rivuli]
MNKPEKQLQRAKRDVHRQIGENDSRTFPSFDSLAAWAVSQGYAESVEAIRQNHKELWPDLLYEWYATNQIACLFAVHLARKWEEAKWYSAVLSDAWDAEVITAIVDAHFDMGTEGLQIIVPGEGTAEEAVRLVTMLASHPRWRCEDTGWLEGEQGDSIHIGLRWISPDNSFESWAVGIAPFEPMPFTRQFVKAPFIALVIRPSAPADNRAPTPTGCSGLPASHLAHMDDDLGDNEAKRQKWIAQTKQGKRALIHPEPLSRARAKVTFSFSKKHLDELNVALRAES